MERWPDPSNNRLITALATLDRTSEKISRFVPDHIVTNDPAVEFILALDKPTHQAQLRAIVARAYWTSEAHSRALAKSIDDERASAKYVRDYDAGMKRFTGNSGELFDQGARSRGLSRNNPAALALERAERYWSEKGVETFANREQIANAFAVLDELAATNRAIAARGKKRGRPRIDGRFFFTLRLAETFAVLFGRMPDVYDRVRTRSKEGSQMEEPEWNDFVRSALTLTGLGDAGLDGEFKRLAQGSSSFPIDNDKGELAWIDYHLKGLIDYSVDPQIRSIGLRISDFHSIQWLIRFGLPYDLGVYEPLPPI
jgi:hypothetical protein